MIDDPSWHESDAKQHNTQQPFIGKCRIDRVNRISHASPTHRIITSFSIMRTWKINDQLSRSTSVNISESKLKHYLLLFLNHSTPGLALIRRNDWSDCHNKI